MKNRVLGKSGLNVSEIGMGCWQFGGDFGPYDDARSTETLATGFDAGVNFFDTADVYGGGHSEEVIGAYLKTNSAPVVATKVGRDGKLYPDNYAEADIRTNIEGSIERLGVDALDLVQLHCVPTEVLRDGAIFATMDKLQAEGLFKHWGASVETIEEAKICLDAENLTSLQIIFNLLRQDAVTELLPQAKAANVGIIVRLPLASGLLTGKFKADTTFAEGDHRNYNANGEMFSVGETFSGIEMSKGVEIVEKLRAFLPEGYSLGDLALRWLLDQDAVTTIIAGCSRPDQVARNAKASDLAPLGDALHEELRKFYEAEVREHIRCPI